MFYRALVQSGQTAPVEALCEALEAEGMSGAAGLRLQPEGPRLRRDPPGDLRAPAAGVVVNLTGFAVSSPGGTRVPTVLEENGAVVLQAVLSGGREEAWAASPRGLPLAISP